MATTPPWMQRLIDESQNGTAAPRATTPEWVQRLIDFFDPAVGGEDPTRYTLSDLLTWDDDELEWSHDYIQNLFPLPESSMFNQFTWVVTLETYEAFRQRPELQASLAKAAHLMFAFYGLEINERPAGDIKLVRSPKFAQASRRWLTRSNHNHLRITRILRSLRVLGADEYSRAFYTFLITDPDVVRIVSSTSQRYWTRAATRPLRLAPSDEDDEEGVIWLAELEK